MASGYTANYGLCQWQPGDKFLREEFNGDNQRMDTVMRRTEDLAERMGHDLYNLLLQAHYEDKESGWKKALVFDDFQDDSLIASISDGLVHGGSRIALSRTGQGDVDLGCTTTNNSLANRPYTKTCTAVGCGFITGFRLYTALVGVPAGYYTASWQIYINDAVAKQGSLALYCPLEKTEQSISIPKTALAAGDTFYIQLQSPTGGLFSYTGTDGGQCGTIRIEPAAAQTGQVTTPALELPDRTLLRAWVRHSGGKVGLAACSGETEAPLGTVGQRQTVNAQGDPCTETELRLNGLPSQTGSLSFRLDLDLGEEQDMSVFDYGVIMA